MNELELQDELTCPCSSQEVGTERNDLRRMNDLVEAFVLAMNNGKIGRVIKDSMSHTVPVSGTGGEYQAVDRDGLRKAIFAMYEYHRRYPEKRIDAAFQHFLDHVKIREAETFESVLVLLRDLCYCEHYGLQSFYTDFSVVNTAMEKFLRDHAEELLDRKTYDGGNLLRDILAVNKSNFENYGRYLFHCPGLSYMKETLKSYYFDCEDIEKTAEYYEKKLFMEREPMVGHRNCIVLRFGYYRIYLRQGFQHTVRELSGCGHDAYFVTGGQKDLYEKFRNAGADFYRPIHFTAFGGMEFTVRDNDGRDLVFGREMVPASPLEWPHFPPKRKPEEKEVVPSDEKKTLAERFREKELQNKKNLIAFGRYPQGTEDGVDVWGVPKKHSEMQRIWWRIVKEEGGKWLLVAERVLFSMPFHEEPDTESGSGVLSWEQSMLRRFLNEDFLETAFSREERDRIVVNRLEPEGRGRTERHFTEDRVFVPSAKEAGEYFSDNLDRMARETDFLAALHGAVRTGSGEPFRWWLRTCSANGRKVGTVSEEGVIELEFEPSFNGAGVRPAIWIWKKK